MFRNHFKTAWRNLVKNKFYSAINIAGLTAGLSVGILILLWVQDELSFDRFHAKADRIYRLENLVGTGSSQQIWQTTVAPIATFAKQELPEVEEATRVTYTIFNSFAYGNRSFTEDNTIHADASFFTIFDFPLIKGNKKNPFPNDNSIVLTESAAKKYFGNEEPIGKVMVANNKVNLTVTGLIKDFPANSSLRHDMILSMGMFGKLIYDSNGNTKDNLSNDFHQFNYRTYLLMKPGASIKEAAVKLRNIHLRNKPDDTDLTYLLQALPAMHLYAADGKESGMESVRIFIIIALVILVIACINYVNLSTARSMLRAKEVSLRKVVGAARWQLFMQFVVETAVLFVIATIFSLGVMQLLMPLFNTISGKQLMLDLTDQHLWTVILITITGTLAASSIYPALLLSSFEPLKALKGKMTARINDALFRKGLVVTQFALSTILIIGTLIIGRQLEYIRSKQLGYDKEHAFTFPMREIQEHYDAVKADLLKQPGVLNVTRADGNITLLQNQTGDNSWDGKEANATFFMRPVTIDKDFISFFKLGMAQGSNFTGAVADSAHFILNETAVREAGIKDPIGKKFRLWKTEGTIIGVVKDFHFASMKQKIEPVIFRFRPNNAGRIFIRTTGKDAPKAIAAAQRAFKQYNAEAPFNYLFLDDLYTQIYQDEQREGTLFNIFSTIAILISCLGLFGLAAYTAQIRTREIGIRKVLGSSVTGIVQLLARDFVMLVLIAIVIAAPVAWYAMNKWLQDFAYKIEIGWSVFMWAGIIAVAIALLTISFQTVKAALANPVKSLKNNE